MRETSKRSSTRRTIAALSLNHFAHFHDRRRIIFGQPEFAVRANRRQRISQLVGQGRQEFVFFAIGILEGLFRPLRSLPSRAIP